MSLQQEGSFNESNIVLINPYRKQGKRGGRALETLYP